MTVTISVAALCLHGLASETYASTCLAVHHVLLRAVVDNTLHLKFCWMPLAKRRFGSKEEGKRLFATINGTLLLSSSPQTHRHMCCCTLNKLAFS